MKNQLTALFGVIFTIFGFSLVSDSQTRIGKEQIEEAFILKTGGPVYGNLSAATSTISAKEFQVYSDNAIIRFFQDGPHAALRSNLDLYLDPTNNGTAGAVIVPCTMMEFPDFVGDKIRFFSHSYKIGISPFTLDITSDRHIKFHSDTHPNAMTLDGDLGNLSLTGNLTVGGTISGGNISSGTDPGHTHTGASISNLDTSDITSGIMPMMRGGTGGSSFNGVLRGNGSNISAATGIGDELVVWNGSNSLKSAGFGIEGVNRLYSKSAIHNASTAGWYRIAQSPINLTPCNGIFSLEWQTGATGRLIISAGFAWGGNPKPILSCLGGVTDEAGTQGITKMRIVYPTTYPGNSAYLEYYKSSTDNHTVNVSMSTSAGWSILDPTTPGSIPDGYLVKEMDTAINALGTTGRMWVGEKLGVGTGYPEYRIDVEESFAGGCVIPLLVQNIQTSANTAVKIRLACTNAPTQNTNGNIDLQNLRQGDGSTDFYLLQSPGGGIQPATTLWTDGSSGNVVIGVTTASANKLTVNGSVWANSYGSPSLASAKERIEAITPAVTEHLLAELRDIPKVSFHWKFSDSEPQLSEFKDEFEVQVKRVTEEVKGATVIREVTEPILISSAADLYRRKHQEWVNKSQNPRYQNQYFGTLIDSVTSAVLSSLKHYDDNGNLDGIDLSGAASLNLVVDSEQQREIEELKVILAEIREKLDNKERNQPE